MCLQSFIEISWYIKTRTFSTYLAPLCVACLAESFTPVFSLNCLPFLSHFHSHSLCLYLSTLLFLLYLSIPLSLQLRNNSSLRTLSDCLPWGGFIVGQHAPPSFSVRLLTESTIFLFLHWHATPTQCECTKNIFGAKIARKCPAMRW